MKKWVTIILLIIATPFILYWGAIIYIIVLMGMADAKYDNMMAQMEKECIEIKIANGYPEDFAHEYCSGDGKGCIEKKYDKECKVGLECCFATIEEDKKWNYLDYDEKGNKIEK